MKLIVEPNRNLHPLIFKTIMGTVVVTDYHSAMELFVARPELVITHLEMKRGDGTPETQPFGLALAAKCLKLGIPFIIVTSRAKASTVALLEMAKSLDWNLVTDWSGSEKDWRTLDPDAEKYSRLSVQPAAVTPIPAV